MKFINLIMLVFFFLGCTSEVPKTTGGGANCTNSASCPDGQLCLDNVCAAAECMSSVDCTLEQYCGDSYSCVEGCQRDDDCYSGDECNKETNTCEAFACRTTDLDCEIGEFCNTTSGECYRDSFNSCATDCSMNELYGIENGPGECLIWDYDPASSCNDTNFGTGCPSGQLCLSKSIWDPTDLFSGVCANVYRFNTCVPGTENACSRGFTCLEDIWQDGTNVNVCIGDCGYYREEGFLQ